MNIKPTSDRVLVLLDEPEDKSPLFITPEAYKGVSLTGRVLAVGPGRMQDDGTRRRMDVAVGDRVLFGRHDGQELEVDGKKMKLLSEAALQAVYED